MLFIKIVLALILFLASLFLGLIFLLVGIWSIIPYCVLIFIGTLALRYLHGPGYDGFFMIAFVMGTIAEVILVAFLMKAQLLGFREVFQGASAPLPTHLLVIFLPFFIYLFSLKIGLAYIK